MNGTLSRSEIRQDLEELATRILWNNSGICELKDLAEAGADDVSIAEHGVEVLASAKSVYISTRAA